MRNLIAGLIVLGTVLVSQSCTYDEVVIEDPEIAFCDTAVVSFSGEILPIITNNCATSGCHKAGSSFGPLTNYAEIKVKIDNGSFEARVINPSGGMPVGGWSNSDDYEYLKCWFENGYENN